MNMTSVYSHKQILLIGGYEPIDHFTGELLSRLTVSHSAYLYLLGSYLSRMHREGQVAVSEAELIATQPLSALARELDRLTGAKTAEDLQVSENRLNELAGSTLPDAWVFHEKTLPSGITVPDEKGDSRAQRIFGTPDQSPLIIRENGFIYLRRFWRYETDISEGIRSRISRHPVLDEATLRRELPDRESDQDRAIAGALGYPFSIITGGPGTGKTRSVLKFLAILLKHHPKTRVVLCAPTGKAAARLVESVTGNLREMQLAEEVRALIPVSAQTVHRLLGWQPNSEGPRFGAHRKLPVDVIVLDEASMVDVAMLARLFNAMEPAARLVMLGDKDQLASVEAGAIFGDLARAALVEGEQAEGRIEVANRAEGHETGADASEGDIAEADAAEGYFATRLVKSWRFSEDSGIGLLATTINRGDAEGSWKLLHSGRTDISVREPDPAVETAELLWAEVREIRRNICALTGNPEERAREALQIMAKHQILSAHRNAVGGSVWLNNLFDRRFVAQADQGARPSGTRAVIQWYPGRPVIITANDYDLKLFNGDTGICLEIDGVLRVAFPDSSAESGIRWAAPAQLHTAESGWVLTAHKSQGSEYERITLLLPAYESEILTRELIYTAVTRARKQVVIHTSLEIWEYSLGRRVQRRSGIAERLMRSSDRK